MESFHNISQTNCSVLTWIPKVLCSFCASVSENIRAPPDNDSTNTPTPTIQRKQLHRLINCRFIVSCMKSSIRTNENRIRRKPFSSSDKPAMSERCSFCSTTERFLKNDIEPRIRNDEVYDPAGRQCNSELRLNVVISLIFFPAEQQRAAQLITPVWGDQPPAGPWSRSTKYVWSMQEKGRWSRHLDRYWTEYRHINHCDVWIATVRKKESLWFQPT